MVESLQVLSILIGIFSQILIINWWLILPLFIMIFLISNIKKFYLPTAQSVKRIESNGVKKRNFSFRKFDVI